MINFLSKALDTCGYTFQKNKYSPYGQNTWHDLARVIDLKSVRLVGDVGAFKGDMTNLFLKYFPSSTIIAIEPSPETYQFLEDRFRNNKRVITKNYGAGKNDGIIEFQVFENGELNSFKQIKDDESIPVLTTKIQVKTIFNIFKEYNATQSQIDFLKIDVEGFEMECLEGASQLFELNAVGMIYIESGFCSDDYRHTPFDIIFKFLTQHSFSFYGLYDYYHYRKPTELLFSNALFLNENYLRSHNLLIK